MQTQTTNLTNANNNPVIMLPVLDSPYNYCFLNLGSIQEQFKILSKSFEIIVSCMNISSIAILFTGKYSPSEDALRCADNLHRTVNEFAKNKFTEN